MLCLLAWQPHLGCVVPRHAASEELMGMIRCKCYDMTGYDLHLSQLIVDSM